MIATVSIMQSLALDGQQLAARKVLAAVQSNELH